ncbi:MAG: hypothetical protein AAFR24_19555 [Cyanobacteria bacterium J06627_3]
MNPIFNPKFTIVTEYPMMFSSTDLGHIELEIRYAISSNETPYHYESSESLGFGHYDSIETLAESYRLLENRRFQLRFFRRKLEYLWKIESNDYPRREFKQSEKI